MPSVTRMHGVPCARRGSLKIWKDEMAGGILPIVPPPLAQERATLPRQQAFIAGIAKPDEVQPITLATEQKSGNPFGNWLLCRGFSGDAV